MIAVDGDILLFNFEGKLVEQLDGMDGVPSGMHRIGKDASGQLIVDAAHAIYQPDKDFLEWHHWEGNPQTIQWKQVTPIPEILYSSLVKHYRGEVLPIERVLLDLHSGRILGRYGVWVMDAAAVLLILLALSGFWMWFRRRR